MTFHTKHNGTWKEVGSNSFYVKVNGVWTVVDEAFVKSGGLWKQYFINEIAVTLASTTNVDAESLFDSAVWTASTPKRIIVPTGVTLGGTGGTAALTIPSNMAGPLNIDVVGDLIGTGGSANGGAGGHAILNNAGSVILNVEAGGQVLAGGGGGGKGGTGGGGSYSSTSSSTQGPNGSYHWTNTPAVAEWGNVTLGGCGGQDSSSCSNGGKTYARSGGGVYGSVYSEETSYAIRRTTTSTINTSGGAGGNGGRGQGYNQTLASGSTGSNGGTNAGKGGTGATGAAYGQSASNGATGANGNRTNGSGGASGGAAGAAVSGTTITLNNAGTVAGSVA